VIALWAVLNTSPVFAQFSAPYDPDFAAPEKSSPSPAPTPSQPSQPAEPIAEPVTEQRPPVITPTVPKASYQLIERPDPSHIIEQPASSAAAKPTQKAEYSIDRFRRIRDAIDRGEEPGSEERVTQGPILPTGEIGISTAAPKPPPAEVELPTYGTSLSVTGRKVIGLNFSEKRFTANQKTSGRAKTTNLIEINQQLQLRMQGKVGPKITVNVDYDDTKTNQQDISVIYNGDPNEVVQNVSFGDIDLTLPSARIPNNCLL
jgi:hypothetical protein